MRANRLGTVVHTDKTTRREDEKLFLYLGKNISNSSIQVGRNSLSLVKARSRKASFYSI